MDFDKILGTSFLGNSYRGPTQYHVVRTDYVEECEECNKPTHWISLNLEVFVCSTTCLHALKRRVKRAESEADSTSSA